MSITLSQVQPSNFLAPANPLVLLNVDHRFEYLRVTNNSPYQLSINLTGTPITLSEFTVKDVEVPDYWQGMLTVTPTVNISTASHAQSNLLTIEGYYKGEIDSPISQQIPQQAVTATASGKPLFTATVGFGSTTAAGQTLNIFNPPNSGVNFTFHSVRVFTNDATNPTADLSFTVGGDNNFSIAVPAVCHTGQANPPVSFSHCTATGASAFVDKIIEVMDMQANVTQDMLDFPDTVILTPGTNLFVSLSSATTGHVVRLTMKWSEDIAVPPQGGVLTGMAITTLVNEGGVLQPVLKATKAGDTPEDVTIMNDGSATFVGRLAVGGLNFLVGSLTKWNVFTGSATNAGVLQAHGLGVLPDFCIFQETGAAGDSNTFVWDKAASDATNVKVWTGNATARNYIALAIKL